MRPDGELLNDDAREQRLVRYRGEIYHPQPSGLKGRLACPTCGSLDSLTRRFSRGTRAEVFSDGTRFEKEGLWHVEIRFDRALEGPLTIGDGRFLGLGLLAPV